MMISPDAFKKQYQNKSIEECIKKRDDIYEKLKFAENASEDYIPTSTVDPVEQYWVYLQFFIKINELILEKYEKQ